MSLTTLLIDDDRAFASVATATLQGEGFNVTTVHALHGARQALQTREFDLILLDRRLPDGDGLTYLQELAVLQPAAAVVVVTADDDITSAVEALRIGAKDYVVKPVDLSDLAFKARRALAERQLRDRLARAESELSARRQLITPVSKAMKNVLETLELIAARPRSPVLLLGETGAGKEVLARRLHSKTAPNGPFVHLNCAAINEQTAESELFGHERGAFTDAKGSRRGLVEIATGGTLFLDEVGELSAALQAKLLTFLDSGQFRRLGGADMRSSTARVVAATNRDLEAGIKSGSFRADLWFRLSVFKLTVPSLRERREDVPVLADAFLDELRREMGKPALRFGNQAQHRLATYPFFGNVRELKNVLERSAVMERGPELTLELLDAAPGSAVEPDADAFVVSGRPITLDELQERYVAHVVTQLGGKRVEAAQALGISYPTLLKRLGGSIKDS